jgi:outer membrane protein TolC
MMRLPFRRILAGAVVLAVIGGLLSPGHLGAGDKMLPPPRKVVVTSPVLTLPEALRQALQYNPGIATLRQQRGIAAAGVVIARTYPYNPVLEGTVRGDNGPADAAVTNHVLNDTKLLFTLELFGQGRYRRQAADANLSKTEWDIAYQELLLAVRTTRAFDAVLYRQEKLTVARKVAKVAEGAAGQIAKLRAQGKLSPADLILIRTDVIETKNLVNPAQLALVAAWDQLRRELGRLDCDFLLQGILDYPEVPADCAALQAASLELRPDLQSRKAAVAQAQAMYGLERADRFGNPKLGPAYELNETNVSFVGAQYSIPIALFNRKQGEIQMRQADIARAALDVKQGEFAAQQEVQAAVHRLQQARAWVNDFKTLVFPALRAGLKEVQELYQEATPAVDYLRVLDFQRRWLKASDAYLDALFELSQAQADLAGAVGDVHLLLPQLPAQPKATR